MKKSEVYSWRLDPALKAALERAARTEGVSMSELLAKIVRGWLDREYRPAEEEQQVYVREQAMKYVGTVRGGDPKRSQQAAERARRIIRKKHGRGGAR